MKYLRYSFVSLGLVVLSGPLFSQSFYAAGGTAVMSNQPRPTGWAAMAIPLSSDKSAWSFTEYDAQLVGKPLAVQTSTRTGIATPCKTMGKVTVYCLGDAGVASAGQTVSSAFAAGIVGLIPIKSFYLVAGFRVVEIPNPTPGAKTTSRIIELGIGRSMR